MPKPALLNTYRAALALKFVGIVVGWGTGIYLINEVGLPTERWWFAAANTLLTLALLFPWWRWVDTEQREGVANRLLLVALALGILFPNIELIFVSYLPVDAILIDRSSLFNRFEINAINAYSQFFMMIPVVLAIWRYRFNGLIWSLGLAGAVYSLTYFLVDEVALNLPLYIIRGFVLLGVALILGFTTYILVEARIREEEKLRLANRQLAEQSVAMEALAVSQERNRLARDLHDTLAHTLSGTAVQLQAVKTLLKIDPAKAAETLQEAQSQIKAGLVESRQAIQALRSSTLEEFGLVTAIEMNLARFGERNQIETDFHTTGQLNLSPAAEQTVYRIVQEGLTNIEKHAGADRVALEINGDNGEVDLRLRDNGIGFEFEPKSRSKEAIGYGLIGMRERAALIEAVLEIESEPGAGTTLRLRLPNKEA